jgi:hypothetical protein
MIMEHLAEYGVLGETEVLRENLPHCQSRPQIAHDLTWDQTRTAVMESQGQTA